MDKIKARKEQQWKDREQHILASAKKIAHCEGWQAVSIRRIADEIAYSVPVIYGHFENKDALLTEIMHEGFAMLDNQIRTAKNAAISAHNQLIAMGLAQLHFALEHRELYQLMFGLGGVVCNAEHHDDTDGIPAEIKTVLEQLKTTNTDAEELLENWFAIVHGFTSLLLHGQTPDQVVAAQKLQKHIERFIRSL